LPAVFVELKANISEFSAKMGEANAEMQHLQKKGEVSFAKLGAVAKTALLGVAGLAAGVAVAGVEMADKFEKSHAKLETALKNGGNSYEEYATQIQAATDAQAKLGFNSAETESALATLTTSLKDPKVALKDLALAADLAKYKNIDLTTASIAVAKAQEGNLRPLKQLGIDLPVAAGGALKLQTATDKLHAAQDKLQQVMADPKHTVKQLTDAQDNLVKAQKKVNDVSTAGTEIMDGLTKAIGGQAAAAAETFGGKMDALKAQVENALTTIGLALMPALMTLANYLEKNVVPVVKAFADGLGGVKHSGDQAQSGAVAFGNSLRDTFKLIKDNMKLVENLAKAFAVFWAVDKAVAAVATLRTVFTTIGGLFKAQTAIAAITAEADAAATGGVSLATALPAMAAIATFFGVGLLSLGGGASKAAVEANKQRGGFRGQGGIKTPLDTTPRYNGRPSSLMGSAGGSGMNIQINVAGSVVQEKDLAVTVRDNMAQMLRRKGINPSPILGV